MTNVRSNLGYIIVSAIAGAGVFISWLLESGLINTVASAGLGIVITLWTQKTIWKREDSIKRVEQVYSPLYGLIKDFIADKERREYLRRGFIQWREMQRDGRHLMIDEKFSEKLDNFTERVENFDMACYKLNDEVIPSILKSATEEVFHNRAAIIPELSIDYEMNNQPYSHRLNYVPDLMKLKNLSDILENRLQDLERSKITNVRFSIVYSKPPLPPRPLGFKENQQRIHDYWELCQEKLKGNETYKFVVGENKNLLEEAIEIKKELTKRMKETWKK